MNTKTLLTPATAVGSKKKQPTKLDRLTKKEHSLAQTVIRMSKMFSIAQKELDLLREKIALLKEPTNSLFS